MGQRVTFDDGKYVDFDGDDPISDDDIAWAERQVYGSNESIAKKPETSLWEDVKIAGTQAAGAIDTGFTLAGRGLQGLAGGGSIEEDDALFAGLAAREKAMQQWANPESKEQSFGGKLAGTALTLPLQIPAMAGQSAVRMKQMIDNEESVDDARTAGLADTALNVAALTPIGLGASLAGRMAIGAGSNVLTGAASDAFTNIVGKTEATKKMYDPLNVENRAMEAIIGAGAGAIGGKSKPPKAADTDAVASRVDEILARKAAAKAAAEQVPPTESPVAPSRPRDPNALPDVPRAQEELFQRPLEAPERPLPDVSPLTRDLPPLLPDAPVREQPLPTINPPELPGVKATKADKAAPLPEITGVKSDPTLWTPGEFRRYDVPSRKMSVEWKSRSDEVTNTQEARVTVRNARGDKIAEAIARPTAEGIKVDIVQNLTGRDGSPLQREKRLAPLIYAVLSEAGDVFPSHNQTRPEMGRGSGEKLWEGGFPKGMVQGGKIPFRSMQRKALAKLGIQPHVIKEWQRTMDDSIKCVT